MIGPASWSAVLVVCTVLAAPQGGAREIPSGDAASPASRWRSDLLAQAAAPGAEDAASKPRSRPSKRRAKKKPIVTISGSADFQFIYDDNILRMSDDTIDRFVGGIEPERYKIETYDDLILSPRLSCTAGRPLLGKKPTTLRFGYIRWEYARNPIKNNEAYSVRLRQPFFAQDFLEASYTYAPPSYIRHYSSRPPFVSRTVPMEPTPFKLTRNAFLLGYSHRLTKKINVRVDGGRTLRYYNRPFMDSDNAEWGAAGIGSVTVSKSFKLDGKYAYSVVDARGYDQVGETKADSDNGDGSYERDLYEMTVGYKPSGRFKFIASCEIMGQHQIYYYTGDKTPWEDALHTGRKDKVYATEITAGTKPVYGPMSLVAGWRYSRRTTSLPASVVAEDAEEKAYKDNRVWVGATYPF